MSQDIAKIQLCWWHLHKAVRTCLQLNMLPTTPYNVECARAEFILSTQSSNHMVKQIQKRAKEVYLVNQGCLLLIQKVCL